MAQTTFSGPVLSKNGFALAAGGNPDSVNVSNQILTADKALTTTQVKALNATPIEVIPAPGAGLYNVFLGAYVYMDYAGTAYATDAGEDLVFELNGGSGAAVSFTSDGTTYQATADVLVWVPAISAAASTLVMPANQNVAVTILAGEWITGTSPLQIRAFYRKVSLAGLQAIV